jgi:hypothetical protein
MVALGEFKNIREEVAVVYFKTDMPEFVWRD